ncbi:thiol peroxidase [Striga asiatica]|uniref:Thiol peroxidase n=1 Tax=Striga asiatica TaxID=4170 RepID=A0A5A7NVG9_STRAF|nr:thiol peroxidase [Striga asiatica]
MNRSGTVEFRSIDLFPAKVTTKLPNIANDFSDVSLSDDRFIKRSTMPREIKISVFSRTDERLCSAVRHVFLVMMQHEVVESRMESRVGTIFDESRENLLLARDDIDERRCASSCLDFSSKAFMLFGNLDKSPASTIRALFLKDNG